MTPRKTIPRIIHPFIDTVTIAPSIPASDTVAGVEAINLTRTLADVVGGVDAVAMSNQTLDIGGGVDTVQATSAIPGSDTVAGVDAVTQAGP